MIFTLLSSLCIFFFLLHLWNERVAVENSFEEYVNSQYTEGAHRAFAVYAIEGKIIICFASLKTNLRNFWSVNHFPPFFSCHSLSIVALLSPSLFCIKVISITLLSFLHVPLSFYKGVEDGEQHGFYKHRQNRSEFTKDNTLPFLIVLSFWRI